MIKPLCPKILLLITFLALTLMLSSVYLYAGPGDTPGVFPTSTSNLKQIDTAGLYQPETPGLLAQAEAQAGEHRCVRKCRRHYEERLRECEERGHPHHHRCKKWARERERECLDKCYREYPR